MSSNYRGKCHWKLLILILLSVWRTSGQQGYFPNLMDLALLKPVNSSSTCGATSSKYCQSSTRSSSLQICEERTCKFDCCSNCGDSKPVARDLAEVSFRTGVTQDGEPRNRSNSSSFRFQGNSVIQPLRVPAINYVNPGFTISVWIKQKARNKGTIISKDETLAPNYANVYQLVIQDYNLLFFYRPTTGSNASVTTYNLLRSQSEKLKPDEWHLLTVAVIDKGLSYYIDGELMNVNYATLTGPISDQGGTLRIGQKYGGLDQYEGFMQDIKMYGRALTNREAIELFTGVLPSAYVASNCRCPPTHPKINAAEPAKCLKNLEGNATDSVSRLADTAHPIEYATDGDTLSFWLSEITENVTIDINLKYTGFQVFYILLTFYGPFPGAITIERSIDGGRTFQPWQYYAEDCVTAFNMSNNGPLSEPDSVHCIQFGKPLESSRGVVTFQTEYPPPSGSNIPLRPFGQGCSNLYCSEKLLQFLKATNVRLHFANHTLVRNVQHRYYGLERILVTGRCECFGHAKSFHYIEGSGGQSGRCVCNCELSTNTEGENCDRCKPLYNKKPFLRGDRDNANPCIKCECNDHANSCIYNQTLDSNPNSRTLGGGGVCIDCQHNTTGRNCEICEERFYRMSGKSLKARDVCTPCGCEGPGVQPGKLDCAKDDSNSSILAGQCDCKNYTVGRQCDKCKDGFYDLKASHVSGCISCGCVLDGTKNRNISCDSSSGQCNCKDRVTGRTCDACSSGYWGLSGHDVLGCKPCNCDPFGTTPGSVSTCNPTTGQCTCKLGVTGRQCNQCSDGFHTLTPNGCTSCNCSVEGTPTSLLNKCNKTTGVCSCKLYVEGKNCDRCQSGFYNLSQSNPQGCVQCACDTKGTVGGSGQCEQQSGNCTCKPLVIGQTCNQCKLGTFGLNQSNPNGCEPCNCFPKGTTDGDRGRPDELQCSSNGQCSCLSSVTGLRCDSCVSEYYWNPSGQGCVQCQCNSVGSVGRSCNATGYCTCKANIGRRQCDRCIDDHYGFPSCLACNCSVAGSQLSQCDAASGKCNCKQNVQGDKCDQCKSGTVNLQQNNKFGCSGAPSEQPAPFATVLSPRSIMLTWSPPDIPNGIIIRYELYRNGTRIYSGLNQTFNDTSLTPDTVYYYYIITFTAAGNTRSLDDGRFYRTLQDAPGGIARPSITNILPRQVTASWQLPSSPNGRIIDYRLISTSSRSSAEVVHCRGIIFTCVVDGLKPYTPYNFTVEACTNGGCGRSDVSSIVTAPTLPDFQPAPNVTSFPGGKAVDVEWDEPTEPNGRILRYELYMRSHPFQGVGALKYNSNPAHDSNPVHFRKTNITGLQPHTEYEFRVITTTAQVSGNRASNWTRHRTGEGTPLGENAMNPSASSFNSSTVLVSWNPVQNPQGIIIRYVIYKYHPPSNTTAMEATMVPEPQRQGLVVELQPYTEYKFTVRACNSYACSGQSAAVRARTKPSAPEGQGSPEVLLVDSSAVYLNWSEPLTPNGPLPPSYNISRAYSALYHPPPLVTSGVHFPGLGYYEFPSDFIRPGAENNIELWFRTQYASGLILFLVSDGLQSDMLAIQLREGKPWLIFDSQDGPAAVTVSQSVRFDDNQWHNVKVHRKNRRGTLTVDSYSASKDSPGTTTVISVSSFYIGGLPPSFVFVRTNTKDSEIFRHNFIGCLRGITSDSQSLDWTSALEAVGVEPQRNGCPARDRKRAVFLHGGGYIEINRARVDILQSNIFSFTLNFRSQLSSGLLLFAHGATSSFSIQFSGNQVKTMHSNSSMQGSLTIQSSSGQICDGNWHNLTVTSFHIGQLTVKLDNIINGTSGISNLQIQSLYVGGVPWGSQAEKVARQVGVNVDNSFGGCIRVYSAASEINYQNDVLKMYNADLDGCLPESTVPVSSQKGSCLSFNSSVVYSGKNEKFNDSSVETFTDYLYRVESYHVGATGSAKSAWIATRSGQGAPAGLQAPIQLIPIPGGTTVRVTWAPPQRPNGVLTKYRILSFRVHPPQSVPGEKTVSDASVLNTTISGLHPYTTYEIKIEAFTVGGSSVGPGKNVTTEESVPDGVRGPSAVRRPRELEVSWADPVHPNGVITLYNLTRDGKVEYSGTDRNFTISNLQVYTEYTLQLTACTRIGCAQGPVVRIRTGELPPEGMQTPVVIVRGRTKVEVNWKPPNITNGKIVRYEVLFATVDVLGAYVSKFNATSDVFKTDVGNLTAGTLYFVRVRAFTGGGGTYSNAAQKRTHEDIPDDIPAPKVIPLSPYALYVIILAPEKPNGNITRYELYQDNIVVPVLNETQLSNYTAGNFTPYSRHTFRVRACTAQGCAYGAEAVAFTKEIAPNGTVTLTASIRNATAVNARWTRVAAPNGKLFYNFMIQGRFIVPGSAELRTEERVETGISVEEAETDFIYNGLLPYSNYTFWLNASNSVGFILSNNVTGSTPEGVPGGLKAPNVTILSSTSVFVSWEQPALPNGNILGYGLYQRNQKNKTTVLFSGLGFSFTVTNLTAYESYEFRVIASTIAGSGFSPWSQVTTFEDVPSVPDPPEFEEVRSTSLIVKWDKPDPANGLIIYYIIYQNGSEIRRVTGNVTSYRVTGLQPFTVYVFKLSACTVVGCSTSSNSNPQLTSESGPQDLSAPRLASPAGRTVVIEWDPPALPNGVIQKYQIQRRLMAGGNPSVISEVDASLSRRYTDNTVKPLTSYQYRIIAFNSVPGDPSPYSNVTTGQGDPEGIAAPSVQALSPYAINVRWTAPTVPNGNVTHYIIRVVHQQTSLNTTVSADAPFEVNVTSLDPYILYNVIVSACTIGGCGSSSPSQVRTHSAKPENQPAPIAEVLSQTEIRVRWDPPKRPNGLVVGYVLFRRTVEDLVSRNISSPTEYVQVQKSGALPGDRVFTDVLLGVYSLQQYKVTVTTSQGNTTSNSSLPYRTKPAPPLAGPTVNGTALNHTTLLITWYPPEIKQLRGAVMTYVVDLSESSRLGAPVSRVGQFPGTQTSVAVRNLKANTYYTFYVELNNGAGTFKSDAFRIRTLDGLPEGFGPPALFTISSTAIRVSWNPPGNPNGNVILYKIYVNDTLWTNKSGNTFQAIVSGLQPYTYYIIKVAVCTTHGCTMSDARAATTNPSAPTGFSAPRLTAGSTFIEVRWEPPSRPNGIMSGYQIFRRMVYPCPTSPPPKAKCTFIECRLSEQLCGVTCYNPANQVCCNGVLYLRDPAKTCCGTNYLRKNAASDVCCGNSFHIQRSEYQCCHGDYIRVPSGSVCCRTSQGGRVVGQGNACCGDTPYNSGGSKVCVCGALYNPTPPRKCCGGSVVAPAQVCCGDETRGTAYDLESSKECCGSQYVNKATSLCCKGSAGDVVVYNYSSAAEKFASSHKCCGKRRVASGLSCCSEQGYNPSNQTCASISSNGTVGCGIGTICNKTDANMAMCDRCDFDNTTLLCGYVPGYYDLSPTTAVPQVCATGSVEILNNQYNPNLRFYNDTNLSPHTLYDYYLVAINNVGNVSSPVAQSRTLMGRPAGLLPPVAVAISSSEIRVTWSKPSTPNGVIREYKLTRINGNQRHLVFTGLNMTFIDRALEPFTGYRYRIEACTTECASAAMTLPIYTDQAAPAYVNASILLPVNYSAINVSWVRPPKPNGHIIRYNVSRVINSTHKIHLNPNDKGLGMSLLIGGLQPYTNYTFEVIACTKVGCTASPLASTRTLQAPPEGVHAPNLTVTGAREIEAKWIEPDILNGVIVKYSLFRGNLLVYNGTDVCYKNNEGKDVCIFEDKGNGLQPVTTYSYSVAATTGGGTTRSGVTAATTPESSPEAIPKPRLSVRSAYSIFAEWDEPGQPNGNITSYSVVVNGTEYNVGLSKNNTISSLNPFTVYSVRVKACTAKGCGLGDREYATTNEAAPTGQRAPTLAAREWNIVQISWSPPSAPNGIITRYEIYRKIGSGAPLAVCITTLLTCMNSGLLGFTEYSYKVRVRNSAGYGDGPWSSVRTLEGPPQGIRPPSLNVLNSTAIYVSWSAPSQPNGIVTHYEVRYREGLGNGAVTVAARVTSNVFNLTVNGLKPFSDYQFLIAAINSRREGTSASTPAKTRQAPPADIKPLKADKAADGRSVRVFWDEPGRPNGLITHYYLYQDGVQIYRGARREYTVSRLTPYTAYKFQLEACTVAGCTRGPSQVIFSAEVNPQGQAPPVILFKNATAIQLSWKPPVVPNGVIIRYEIRRTVTVQSRRKRAVALSSRVYSTNDTNQTDFQYTDTKLKAYTSYSYFVRVVNKGGYTDSDPVSLTTDQAPPASMDAPRVTSVDARSLNVSWTKPRESNGIIQYYIVFRNGSVKHKKNDLSFLDQGLDPYTVYSYTVEACTGGGCRESPPSSRRTAQAPPSGVHPPVLKALSAVAIRISWREPGKPNGIITKYQLFQAGEDFPRYEGPAMSFDISNKQPYTEYSFYIKACTVEGCTQSPAAQVRTKEGKPQGLDAPTVTVGGSAFVRVEWNAPRRPNGLILYYLLIRNGSQVYNGTDLRFNDYTIAPFTVYAYVVTAVNFADRLSSPPGFSPPTNPGAPDNVSSATLEVLSATSIKATWSVPGRPNGVITKYEVLYSFKGAQGNVQLRNAGLAKELTLTGLQPYTEYEVRIRACTKEGCSTGEATSARTFEARPDGQSPPDFPRLHISARRVLVNWNEPQKPNGFMLMYRLYRRGYSLSGNQQQVYGPDVSVANVTNGSALEFNDTTVKPYFRYEYRIVSANSAGETASAWSVVQTLSAPPEQLKAPQVNKTHSFSLEVLILAPGTPNGEIRNYILEVSGKNKSKGLNTLREISGLEPFTVYVLRVYVCTDGGCARGPSVNSKTAEGTPTQFSAPRPVEINATAILLEWDKPGKPNGKIQRYEVLYRKSCAVGCPTGLPESGTNVGLLRRYVVRDLFPYTMYNFRIRVYNQRYSSLSDEQAVRTQASAPLVTNVRPRVNVTGFQVAVDWSGSFILNGPLDTYELLENGLLTYEGPQNKRNLGTRNVGEYTYIAKATTLVQGKRVTVTAPPSATVQIQAEVNAGTTAPLADSEKWYQSAWFIAVMSLVAILILFFLIAVCLWRTSGNRTVYVRGREPLPPRAKLRSRPPSMSSLYTSSDRKNGSIIDMQPTPMPNYSSTTALYDSTERLNRMNEQYDSLRSRSGHKAPLDVSQDWDGYLKSYSKDRDSGLYDDEKFDFSDSEPSTPYQSFKREQYFTDTHL